MLHGNECVRCRVAPGARTCGDIGSRFRAGELLGASIHELNLGAASGDGLPTRVGADPLGHAKISMTRDEYVSRGRVHAEVAALPDRTMNDEGRLLSRAKYHL